MTLSKSSLLLAALGLTAAAHAQFTETEANETKATANAFSVVPGSTITGNTTGTSTTVAGAASADTFRLNFGAAAPAIYRNQLTLTTATGTHAGTLRGVTQTAGTANPATDISFQITSTAIRYNQFYTFGAATSLYYRVTGATATTGDYTSTLTQTVVTPTDLGNFATGAITFATTGISTGTNRADTSILVLDSNLNAIPGFLNEDASGTDLGSTLARTYAAGTYYFAISNFRTANEQGAPTDDAFRSGTLLDFAGVIVNSNTTTGTNLGFTVTDANGTLNVVGTKAAAYDVNFYKFTVGAAPVPEPATMAVLGLGAAALLRRRRKSA